MTEQNLALAIANDLGETDLNSLQQIAAIVTALGEPEALALLGQTLIVEGDGGLLVTDGSRRRSPGGMFFHLARKVLSRDAKQRIFFGKGQRRPSGEEASNAPLLERIPTADGDSEIARARREVKAALWPLPSELQRALLLHLVSKLSPQVSEAPKAESLPKLVSAPGGQSEVEAEFRSLLAVVGLARARHVLDEVEAVLTG